jgi:hypothetical protein
MRQLLWLGAAREVPSNDLEEQEKKDLVAFEINTTNGECLVFPIAAGHTYSVVQDGL